MGKHSNHRVTFVNYVCCFVCQGPAKKWEEALLNLKVVVGEPGIEVEEIVSLAKENVATA